MTLKNDEISEEKLTCRFKIDIRNFTNFDSSTRNSQKFTLQCFWPKYMMFELKNYRGIMFDGTEDWCQIWRKTDLCFQKWHIEFGKFSFTGWKIAILF